MKMEFVQITTDDGLVLPGLLYQSFKKPNKRIAIHLHGNGTSCVFYKTNTALFDGLCEAGIDSFVFNNRGAHMIHSHKVRDALGELVRVPTGMTHELIKDCVYDIDAALDYARSSGYEQFVLIGSSTGANKICVYNRYRPENMFDAYVLSAGGDDTGIYYQILGKERFFAALQKAKQMIDEGEPYAIMKELIEDGMVFGAQGYYDIANPDGDYNCFPFMQAQAKTKLSKSLPLFDYYSKIKKPSLVVYGELDEYCGSLGATHAVETLKSYQPTLDYHIIPGADHAFTDCESALAQRIVSWLKTISP